MSKAMFYGTGAAEGIPDPFCNCFLCRYAREHGGKDVRTRSMFRVDSTMIIDMGADAYTQANRYGDFTELTDVLITHTHEDHFCYMMMSVWKMATVRSAPCLNYYFVEKSFDIVDVMRANPVFMKGMLPKMETQGILQCHKLNFFETYSIGGKRVTPLKGHHWGNMGDQCANYLIEMPNGTTLYYGADTGKYEPETMDYLKQIQLDVLISECTNGNGEDAMPDPTHLSYTTSLATIRELRAMNILRDDSRIYLTHINHLHTAYHSRLQDMWDHAKLPNPCTVAWDGLEIEL